MYVMSLPLCPDEGRQHGTGGGTQRHDRMRYNITHVCNVSTTLPGLSDITLQIKSE